MEIKRPHLPIHREKSQKESPNGLKAPSKLVMLITIVNRSKSDFFIDLIEGFKANFQTVIYGSGTAPSEVKKYLGLGNSEKAIIFSLISEKNLSNCLNALVLRFENTRNGKGIAYSVPLNSVIGVLIYQFLSNNQTTTEE